MNMTQNTFELFEKLHHPAIIAPSEPLHQKWLYIILAKTVVIAHTVQTKIVFFFGLTLLLTWDGLNSVTGWGGARVARQ